MNHQVNVLSFTDHQPTNLIHGDANQHLITSQQETPRCQRSVNEHHNIPMSYQHQETPNGIRSVTQHDTDEGVASMRSVQCQEYTMNPQTGARSRVIHLHQPLTVPGSQLPHQPVILLHRPSDEEIDV